VRRRELLAWVPGLTRTPGGLPAACWLTAQGSSLCRLPAPSWPAPPVTGFYLAR
jgi:hypothetical protein